MSARSLNPKAAPPKASGPARNVSVIDLSQPVAPGLTAHEAYNAFGRAFVHAKNLDPDFGQWSIWLAMERDLGVDFKTEERIASLNEVERRWAGLPVRPRSKFSALPKAWQEILLEPEKTLDKQYLPVVLQLPSFATICSPDEAAYNAKIVRRLVDGPLREREYAALKILAELREANCITASEYQARSGPVVQRMLEKLNQFEPGQLALSIGSLVQAGLFSKIPKEQFARLVAMQHSHGGWLNSGEKTGSLTATLAGAYSVAYLLRQNGYLITEVDIDKLDMIAFQMAGEVDPSLP